MRVLPFKQLDRINNQLTDDLLQDLVAVFSRQGDDRLLLVYLTEAVPQSVSEKHQVIVLNDLPRYNLSDYNGLVVAFSAIDVIHPNIPTKGPAFYSLSHLLLARKLYPVLQRTSSGLSRYLVQLLSNPEFRNASDLLKQRAENQVVWLASRALLAQLPWQDLVVLVPDRNLSAYVEEGRCRVVYREPPTRSSMPATVQVFPLDTFYEPDFLEQTEKVVALEEVYRERGDLVPETTRFQELRLALRQSGSDDSIVQTLRSLAKYFYHLWGNDSNVITHLRTAYELGLESQLEGIETDDLIGVFPHNDFEEFIENGSATYLYRQLPEGVPEKQGSEVGFVPLSELALPDEYRRITFSLPPLHTRLRSMGTEHCCDLGPLFCRAGKASTLAQNAWLLVRDLAEQLQEKRQIWGVSYSGLIGTISHSCELFSLEDPWLARRGQYWQTIAAAYDTLFQVLESQELTSEAADQPYYRALRLWYECERVENEKIESTLREMVKVLQEYEQRSRFFYGKTSCLKERGERLERTAEAILHMLGGGGQLEVIKDIYAKELDPRLVTVPQAVRLAADLDKAIEIPSRLFRRAFQEYAQIVERIHHIRDSLIPVTEKISQLLQQIENLHQARQVVFAPYHEQRILDLLYQRAIDQTQSMATELQGNPQFVVELSTPSVLQHEKSALTFVIRNIGRVEAETVQIELARSDHFRLMEESSTREIAAIPPEKETRQQFYIVPIGGHNFTVQLRITYRDSRQQVQTRQSEFLVSVVSLDKGPFQHKANPYVYGVPLQDYRFFYGRRQELESLLSHLAGGRPQNVLLRGARRSGKTSALNMVKAIIEDRKDARRVRGWFSVPRDWDSTLDHLQVIFLDLQEIERREGTLSPTSFYRAILSSIATVGWANDKIQVLVSEPNISTSQFENALITALREHAGMRLVLLMDEFDVVDTITDKTFYANLRHIISNVQGVTWIISSALGLYKEVHAYESPLFNVFKITDLKRLEREAAKALILDPWQHRDSKTKTERSVLQFTDDAIEAILYETGCYPYFIQLLCSAIVDYANSVRTNYVLQSMVAAVIERTIAPHSAAYEHLAYLWDGANALDKAILLTLLESVEAPNSQELWQSLSQQLGKRHAGISLTTLASVYETSLRRLQAVEAIALDSRNCFTFGIPLFQRLLTKRSELEDLWSIALQGLAECPGEA